MIVFLFLVVLLLILAAKHVDACSGSLELCLLPRVRLPELLALLPLCSIFRILRTTSARTQQLSRGPAKERGAPTLLDASRRGASPNAHPARFLMLLDGSR